MPAFNFYDGSPASSPYQVPAWLHGAHAQTIYAALFAPKPHVQYRRETWDTPDGDFIEVDWLDASHQAIDSYNADSPASSPHPPIIVLFHGLEGNSQSHYARALMRAVEQRGWHGVVIHFRGCGGTPNRLRRAYHSGDSVEIDWTLRRLKQQYPTTPIYVIGVSLGGNALLKWLGEQNAGSREIVAGAAAISAPLDLMIAGDALGKGFNRFYSRHFLKTLKRKIYDKLERFPDICDRKALDAADTLRDFDNIVTAPLHGYKDTDDYWTRASSKPYLKNIAVPALVINALDDPFMPAFALPRANEVSESVILEMPAHGGHVAFVSASFPFSFPGNLNWMPTRVLDFFSHVR